MDYDLYACYEDGVLCISDNDENVLFNSLLTDDNKREAEEIFEDKECLVPYEESMSVLQKAVPAYNSSESLMSDFGHFVKEAGFTIYADDDFPGGDEFYVPLPEDYLKYNDVEVHDDGEVFYVLIPTVDDIYKILFGEDYDRSLPSSIVISRCSEKLKSSNSEALEQEIQRWIIEKVKDGGLKDSSHG